MPCLDEISEIEISNSVDLVQGYIRNNDAYCIDRENGVVNRYQGSTDPTIPHFYVEFLPCEDHDHATDGVVCLSSHEAERWWAENTPRLLVLGTKRLIDF